MLAGVQESDNAFAVLKEFEQRVEKEEALALAYEDMAEDRTAGTLEKEFEQLDLAKTDAELEKLKAEMGKE